MLPLLLNGAPPVTAVCMLCKEELPYMTCALLSLYFMLSFIIPLCSSCIDDTLYELKSPLTKDYKAGSAVHFHSEGPGMYSACKEKDPSTEWEKVSVTVSGIQTTAGTPKNDQWWAGTKYAKIRFLVTTSDRKAKVQLRNIKLIVE